MAISNKRNKNSAYASRHQMSLRASCWLTTAAEKEPTTSAVKKFLSSRLIMNSRQLWNSHHRHKFLRAKASRDILKFRVSEMVFKRDFYAMLFRQHTCKTVCKTGNNVVEMSHAFHDIARFRTLKLTFHRSKPVYKICVQCHSKLGN